MRKRMNIEKEKDRERKREIIKNKRERKEGGDQ